MGMISREKWMWLVVTAPPSSFNPRVLTGLSWCSTKCLGCQLEPLLAFFPGWQSTWEWLRAARCVRARVARKHVRMKPLCCVEILWKL
ncbi:hypothetical protein OPV22_011202 [Ensete ventricosum]|uniref:Secreted protein n=1 Tax=Ensete ventricosum TaxID=4639 RepID=A0AAV8PWN4_ENSVE|nr:hypothetical protein OPV22_011202 [Ensete ventricosum]